MQLEIGQYQLTNRSVNFV